MSHKMIDEAISGVVLVILIMYVIVTFVIGFMVEFDWILKHVKIV